MWLVTFACSKHALVYFFLSVSHQKKLTEYFITFSCNFFMHWTLDFGLWTLTFSNFQLFHALDFELFKLWTFSYIKLSTLILFYTSQYILQHIYFHLYFQQSFNTYPIYLYFITTFSNTSYIVYIYLSTGVVHAAAHWDSPPCQRLFSCGHITWPILPIKKPGFRLAFSCSSNHCKSLHSIQTNRTTKA